MKNLLHRIATSQYQIFTLANYWEILPAINFEKERINKRVNRKRLSFVWWKWGLSLIWI